MPRRSTSASSFSLASKVCPSVPGPGACRAPPGPLSLGRSATVARRPPQSESDRRACAAIAIVVTGALTASVAACWLQQMHRRSRISVSRQERRRWPLGRLSWLGRRGRKRRTPNAWPRPLSGKSLGWPTKLRRRRCLASELRPQRDLSRWWRSQTADSKLSTSTTARFRRRFWRWDRRTMAASPRRTPYPRRGNGDQHAHPERLGWTRPADLPAVPRPSWRSGAQSVYRFAPVVRWWLGAPKRV